jgi:hypothetical protein
VKVSSHFVKPRVAFCALFGIATSCARGNAKSPADSAGTRPASPHEQRSGQAKATPSLARVCDTTATVVCYRDTARSVPGAADPAGYPLANWIWFAVAGDSIEISAIPPAYVQTSIGEERDSLHNVVQHFRRRFRSDGVVEVFLALREIYGDTVPYTLRVLRSGSGSNASLRPTGEAATLTVVSRHKGDAFSLVPISIAPNVRDRSQWRIWPMRYKVALVSDSLYELCRLPCSAPDTVKLTPSADLVKKF